MPNSLVLLNSSQAHCARIGLSFQPSTWRRKPMSKKLKKVVLAYSGGLDTSIILKWLQQTYGCEVVTFTANLGQGEELEPARRKAEQLGATDIRIEDVREEFVRDF
ncbi:argininosuccinate synthase, putative, partial [Ricinus communis]